MHKFGLTPEKIESWVSRNLEYKEKRGGNELLANLPGEDGYKLNIALHQRTIKKKNEPPRTDYWVHHWRPYQREKYDGSFLNFVRKFKNISFHDAIREVCGNIDIKSAYSQKPQQEEVEEIEISLPDDAIYFRNAPNDQFKQVAMNALRKRGLSQDVIYSNDLAFTVNSVVFPYIEYGVLVYWQARDILNKRFEFPDRKKFNVGAGDFLYGFDHIEPGQTIWITESIIDALSLPEGGVAIGGAVVSDRQIKKIRSLNPGRIVLALDNDEAGRKSTRDMFFALRKGLGSTPYFVMPPDPYKDWNDMLKDKGQHAVSKAASDIKLLTPPVLAKLS